MQNIIRTLNVFIGFLNRDVLGAGRVHFLIRRLPHGSRDCLS